MANIGKTKEYRAWCDMKRRCYDPRRPQYHNYGGRGITVCDAWRQSFPQFLADVGPAPSAAHSLDRIDNTKGYTPGNVRWATAKEQGNNVRANVVIIMDGTSKTAAEWAEHVGLHPATLRYRLANGAPPELAIGKPSRGWRGLVEFNGERKTVSEWSAILGVPATTVRVRARKGVPLDQYKRSKR